jgi:formate transporter
MLPLCSPLQGKVFSPRSHYPSHTLAQAFLRAILANWLVCIAVWNASSATTLPGKILGLWPPIMTFVAIGLEHSVANMFFIP